MVARIHSIGRRTRMANWSKARQPEWGRHRRLFRADGLGVLQALLRLIMVDVRLRRGGFRDVLVRASTRVGPRTKAGGAADVARAGRYAGLLQTASRVPFLRARCLHQSLALYLWLRDEGVASELRIGIRKEGGALRAHAWIELGGQVVNDRPASVVEFTPLFSTGRDGALPDGAAQVNEWSTAWS
jgi:hypothetical protein